MVNKMQTAELSSLRPNLSQSAARAARTVGPGRLVDKGISATDGPLHLVGVDGVAVADLREVLRRTLENWWVIS